MINDIKNIAIKGYDQGNPFKFEDILQIIAEYEGKDKFTEYLSGKNGD